MSECRKLACLIGKVMTLRILDLRSKWLNLSGMVEISHPGFRNFFCAALFQ